MGSAHFRATKYSRKTTRFTAAECAAAFVLVLLLTALTRAQAPTSIPGQLEGTRDLWFVELASPPAVDGTTMSVLEQEKEAFRSLAALRGLQIQERFAFNSLWNGLSIRIDPKDVGRLAGFPGVRAIYPVQLAHADPERPPDGAELFTALAMTGADVAHDNGYTGAGISVAVIDSGIDYEHPDLGGCFGPGCRVVDGFDFVGDAYQPNPAAPGYNPIPVPDPNPDDCNGHGTHVSGIVGARAASPLGITGVAPGVTFSAYRVFGCGTPVGSGVSTNTDVLLAAMEAVGRAKPQVLNMSIGSSFQWPRYPTGRAAARLVQMGIVVVASIGNDGGTGAYSASSPGVAENVIGVASFDNTHVRVPVLRISPDNVGVGFSPASGAPLAPTAGTLPLRRTGSQTSTADACSSTMPPAAPPPGSLAGAAALIRRGTCSFYEKAINAQSAGALAVVLYNNVPGLLNASVIPPTAPPGLPAVTIPVVGVSDVDGNLIDSRLQAGGPDSVTLTWTTEIATIPNLPSGGLISAFSAYGLAPDLTLKPDIGAPGGAIRSTYPLDHPAGGNGYATLSGTSMSSPHTAGAVALLLEAKPSTAASSARDILQNSADPQLWSLNPATGLPDSVHRQGAGMLDIPGAIRSTTLITPAKLSLGEVEGASVTRAVTIANSGSTDVTYTLSHVASGGDSGDVSGHAGATQCPSVSQRAGRRGVQPELDHGSSRCDCDGGRDVHTGRGCPGRHRVQRLPGVHACRERCPLSRALRRVQGGLSVDSDHHPHDGRTSMACQALAGGRVHESAGRRVVFDDRDRHSVHLRSLRSPVVPCPDDGPACGDGTAARSRRVRGLHAEKQRGEQFFWFRVGWQRRDRIRLVRGTQRPVPHHPLDPEAPR